MERTLLKYYVEKKYVIPYICCIVLYVHMQFNENIEKSSAFVTLACTYASFLAKYLQLWACQMVYLYTKNPICVYFRALEWKILVYFMAISNSLFSFVIFYGHLVYVCGCRVVIFFPIWYVVGTKKNLATLMPTCVLINRCSVIWVIVYLIHLN
jgi:hypothetical protein